MQPWSHSLDIHDTEGSCPTCGMPHPTGHNPLAHMASHLECLEAVARGLTLPPYRQQQSGQVPSPMRLQPALPIGERTIWRGRPMFFAYAPGLVWSGGWLTFWSAMGLYRQEALRHLWRWAPEVQTYLARLSIQLDHLLQRYAGQWLGAVEVTEPAVQTICLLMDLGAGWGLLRRLQHAFGTSYRLTTRCLTMRVGVFSPQSRQLDLGDLEDIRIRHTLLGHLCGYVHVQFVPSPSAVGAMVWRGVPDVQLTTALLRATMDGAHPTRHGGHYGA